MKIFFRRATYQILNQSSIPTLLKRIEAGQRPRASEWASACGNQAIRLLNYASKHLPVIFKAHRNMLLKAIAAEEPTVLTETCLRALSCLVRADKESASSDK